MVVGSEDFEELENLTKRQNKKIIESMESEIPGHFESISKGISEEFDVDFAVKLAGMMPLEPHYESDNALSYSMYVSYGTSVEGMKKNFSVASTATYLNVAGKVLFLYCYGPQGELDWTRRTSRAWADAVLASNSRPPAGRSIGRGIDWNEVLEKGLIGAVVGSLIALALGLARRSRSKGRDRRARIAAPRRCPCSA